MLSLKEEEKTRLAPILAEKLLAESANEDSSVAELSGKSAGDIAALITQVKFEATEDPNPPDVFLVISIKGITDNVQHVIDIAEFREAFAEISAA